jgi:hypothetical protein
VIFKSTGDGVKVGDLTISHSAGLGEQALSSKQLGFVDYLYYVWFAVILIASIYYFQQGAVSYRESMSRYKEVGKLLNERRPWYTSVRRWRKLLKEALDYRIERRYFQDSNLKASEPYTLLSADRPSDLDESDWQDLVRKAITSLAREYSAAIPSFSIINPAGLVELLRTERPKHFSEDKWNELVEKENEHYLSLKLQRIYNPEDAQKALEERRPDTIRDTPWREYVDRVEKKFIALKQDSSSFLTWKSLPGLLRETRPDVVREVYWGAYIDKLRRQYRQELSSQVDSPVCDPLGFISEQDLSVLQAQDRRYLEDKAYRLQLKSLPDLTRPDQAKKFLDSERPAWLSDEDYEMLHSIAENTLELKRRAEELNRVQEEVEARHKENDAQASKLEDEKEALLANKDKIERQLRIIHDLLTDPPSLERLEDYNNVFAPGNFDNLKKVATILKGQKT